MLVGEAPGRDEDIEGLPFVGRSGKLLDRMLAAIGLDRTSVYIANIVPWRPPGNRTPTPQELQICLPFIVRQIELADPDILVCLGGPSAQTLLGIKEGITKTRGRWFAFETGKREIRAMPTFHPAFCCVAHYKNGLPGAISWQSRKRSINDKQSELRRSRSRPRPASSAQSNALPETKHRTMPRGQQRACR